MTTSLPAGLSVRAPTLEDVPALVTLMNRYAVTYYGWEVFTERSIHRQWGLTGFDAATDAWVVSAPDGQLVGYGHVFRWHNVQDEMRIGVWAYVHPDYEGQGIGATLLLLIEGRGRELIAEAAPGARVYIMQVVGSNNKAARQLLEQQGYTETRHDWNMEITLNDAPPTPVWPDGITLRTFIAGQDGHPVFAAWDDAFQDHRGHQSEGYEQWEQDKLQRDNFDPTLCFLALDGAEIAGFALCYLEPDEGLVDTLGVRRPWRRKGLGMALLQHAFGEFYRRGMRKVALGVDAESLTGANRLYERAGMYVTARLDRYEKTLRPGKKTSTP